MNHRRGLGERKTWRVRVWTCNRDLHTKAKVKLTTDRLFDSRWQAHDFSESVGPLSGLISIVEVQQLRRVRFVMVSRRVLM